MLELTLLGTGFILIGIVLWYSANSDDDDNSGGGLMEPALVPIPVRTHRR
jgi:hypothetical protein